MFSGVLNYFDPYTLTGLGSVNRLVVNLHRYHGLLKVGGVALNIMCQNKSVALFVFVLFLPVTAIGIAEAAKPSKSEYALQSDLEVVADDVAILDCVAFNFPSIRRGKNFSGFMPANHWYL